MLSEHVNQRGEVVPIEATRFGGASAGHDRGIKPVEIHREIERLAAMGF